MMFYEMILWLQARMQSDERGAAAVEYGMLVALIAAIIIVTVGLLGKDILAAFKAVEAGFH